MTQNPKKLTSKKVTSNLHLVLLNPPQIFGQIFDQIFGQVFDQGFWPGFWPGFGGGEKP